METLALLIIGMILGIILKAFFVKAEVLKLTKDNSEYENRISELLNGQIVMMDILKALRKANELIREEKELYHQEIANNFLLLSLSEAKVFEFIVYEYCNEYKISDEYMKTVDKLYAFIQDKEKITRAKNYDYTYPQNLWVRKVIKVWRDINGAKVELDCGHTIDGGSFNFHHIKLGDDLGCPLCISLGVNHNVKN